MENVPVLINIEERIKEEGKVKEVYRVRLGKILDSKELKDGSTEYWVEFAEKLGSRYAKTRRSFHNKDSTGKESLRLFSVNGTYPNLDDLAVNYVEINGFEAFNSFREEFKTLFGSYPKLGNI